MMEREVQPIHTKTNNKPKGENSSPKCRPPAFAPSMPRQGEAARWLACPRVAWWAEAAMRPRCADQAREDKERRRRRCKRKIRLASHCCA